MVRSAGHGLWLIALGCPKQPECKGAPASIVVEIHVEDAVREARSLEIELSTPETSRREIHGFASEVRLAIAPEPEPGAKLAVTVRAFGDADAAGIPIGQGQVEALVDPDGCNHVVVMVSERVASLSDAGAADADLPDADADEDAGVEEICGGPDKDTIFLHTFDVDDPTRFDDVAGSFPGSIEPGPVGTAGPEGCGRALAFAGAGYGVVPSSPAFDLDLGSLDFWVRVDGTPADAEGIVSRDALGTTRPGHLTVSRSCDDRIIARIQSTNDVQAYRCSEPLVAGSWSHITLRFGPPDMELIVDGVEATTASVAVCGGPWIDCSAPFTGGIAGNENPWVYGASSVMSEEGSATPVFAFLSGALDSVRLSSQR